MRILITGGAGFIGSHLVDRFMAEGHEVIVLDNLITGRRENIAHHLDNPRFTFREHDVVEPFEVEGPLDWVLHFASCASPPDYLAHPVETLRVGSEGTRNCLELARSKGAKFMLASTSEVYGDPLVHPQPETYWGNVNPVGPRSCYDEAKRYAEALTMAYHRQYGLDTRIARIFNTYGPRMRLDDGRVVPNFICQALRGEPLTIYGDGGQTRSLCYVSDMVEGLARAIVADGLVGEVFNLGSGEESTVAEIAKQTAVVCGVPMRCVFLPLPIDDPRRRCPDVTKARRLLGWQPQTHMGDGLAKTASYFGESIKLCLCR